MNFFLPFAETDTNIEEVYKSIAHFINENIPEETDRVYSIRYSHNGIEMTATVGKNCDNYYRELSPVVIAIFKGDPYKICLENRGVITGEPIYVDKTSVNSVTFFDK